MRSVRLLPIVIFAALALLLFKGVGLVTNGGYELTGPVAAVANESGGEPDMPMSPTPSEVVLFVFSLFFFVGLLFFLVFFFLKVQ